MPSCTRRLEFDAGHRVPLHESKCRHLHGHRYVAEITCEAEALTPEGFVVDFGAIKQKVGGWIDDHWDHALLLQHSDPYVRWIERVWREEIEPGGTSIARLWLFTEAPTAEVIAHELLMTASQLLASTSLRVTHVRVYETPNCWADAGE